MVMAVVPPLHLQAIIQTISLSLAIRLLWKVQRQLGSLHPTTSKD
jgi:hypothetical protein